VSATSDRTPQLAPHLPVLALVGRPNVGKSAIFNRIVGERRAIVDDVPGVTRDRLVAAARHDERSFLCIDTGGFDAGAMGDAASLAGQVRAQALAAVEEADCLVCVLDGQAGLSPADTELVRLLARTGTPVVVASSKKLSESALPAKLWRRPMVCPSSCSMTAWKIRSRSAWYRSSPASRLSFIS
jgi:GTP-binding protein